MCVGNGMYMKVDGIYNFFLYLIFVKDSRNFDVLLVVVCVVDLFVDFFFFFELGNGVRNVFYSFSGMGNCGDMWCYCYVWMLLEWIFRW